jgi:hypothetical protein
MKREATLRTKLMKIHRLGIVAQRGSGRTLKRSTVRFRPFKARIQLVTHASGFLLYSPSISSISLEFLRGFARPFEINWTNRGLYEVFGNPPSTVSPGAEPFAGGSRSASRFGCSRCMHPEVRIYYGMHRVARFRTTSLSAGFPISMRWNSSAQRRNVVSSAAKFPSARNPWLAGSRFRTGGGHRIPADKADRAWSVCGSLPASG